MASKIFCCCYKANDTTNNNASHPSTTVTQQNQPVWGSCFMPPNRRPPQVEEAPKIPRDMNVNAHQRAIQRRYSFISPEHCSLFSLQRP
ncbi:testis-expressed protein 53 [Mus musculus]|uniref:Testis expressed 53 n=1 Tax=Mus musculus TaxID=10090 RepID=A0A1B0GR83_MOUSE|nr:testis-expressed protein 53 [Mus musculus]